MNQLNPLPNDVSKFMNWSWDQIKPYYDELAARELNADEVDAWLKDWSKLSEAISETQQRLYVATTLDTADESADQRFKKFLDTIYQPSQAAEQKLKEKLLAGGLEPRGFEIPLRNMRAEAELFRSENLPLLSEEQKLETEYDKIIGADTVVWEGKEITLLQLTPVFQNPDRALRERAWRLSAERQLQDRDAITEVWRKALTLRRQLAKNAGFSDYRSFRWKQLLRFDYTPAECKNFHQAIAEVVVPAASRLYEKRRAQVGLDRLRPWDLTAPAGFGRVVDPPGITPLEPFSETTQLETKCAEIFQRVDPQLAGYFTTMEREGLLDLTNRKNKAPGGYCTSFDVVKRPFIFMNAVGLHRDVQTLLHEAGHAFHVFETNDLPYYPQRAVGMEFAEVASMSMELLSAPYLSARNGGFYSDADAARARREHLEQSLFFWPYMAAVDAFQHWVYENDEVAMDPVECDARWWELYRRYIPDIDYDGVEEAPQNRWQRQAHIQTAPFYYVEYGLAQLGAVQVWANALQDQAGAVKSYRRALSLGGTVPLPKLFETAGARLAFDAETLREAVELMEGVIEELDAA